MPGSGFQAHEASLRGKGGGAAGKGDRHLADSESVPFSQRFFQSRRLGDSESVPVPFIGSQMTSSVSRSSDISRRRMSEGRSRTTRE